MTEEELKAIPFHFVAHLSMEHEHTLSYESDDGRLGFCDHTPRRKNGDFGRSHRYWRIEGKVYKTKEKFLAALADYNPNVVSINRQPYQNVVARMKHEIEAQPPATIKEIEVYESKDEEGKLDARQTEN
ncbi:MAG: hypothetical protein IJ640_07925 [Prevotella sp.]|nr:hypothetical protein [Prevotella sp.]